LVNGVKSTNKSNQACLNFENVTLKEGQSRSQWCGLPNVKVREPIPKRFGNSHRARLIIKTLKLGVTGNRV